MKNKLEILKERFIHADTEREREAIDREIRALMNIDGFSESMVQIARESADKAEELRVKEKLKEVLPLISISYITKIYFNKSRQWFYQKLNGNIVNGKPAKFTAEEIETLNYALKDVSRKLAASSVV